MAIDQDITNLPTPPSRSDSPSDFSDKADTFLAALPTLQTELNTYADEANATQQVINTSESNAATSETNAEDWASKITGLVLTTDYSAKAYAIGGTGVTDVTGAAKEWAVKTGTTVDGSDYSAKDYAISLGTITDGSAKEWAVNTGSTVDASEYSAKDYASSQDLISTGSSKDWAIKTGGTVDGTDFSAKKYANDAEASASAAAATAGATAWSAGVTYDINDAAIGSDGNTYRSLVDNNTGNDPVADDGSSWLKLTGDPSGDLSIDGTLTANSFVGDGSQLTNLPAGTVSLTASGSLANGDLVIVNSDGTVSVVEETNVTQALGSTTLFESDVGTSISTSFDSSANKVVVAYGDSGSSVFGTVIIGSVSGTSISFGTPAVFNSADTREISSTFDPSTNKVVIAYQDRGNNFQGTAIVGTVSGTSISFGTSTVFEPNESETITPIFDPSNNKVVIIYRRPSSASRAGRGIVGTVSGTSISFGSPAEIQSNIILDQTPTFDSKEEKVVVAYRDNENSEFGTSVVGTVSGDNITFGTPTVFESAKTTGIGITFDSSANKVVISYKDEGNSNFGTVVLGTVNGELIGFNSPTVFHSANFIDASPIFDPQANKTIISYADVSSSLLGTSIVGTVSGDSITFGTPFVFNSSDSRTMSSVFDSNENRVVIAYRRGTSLEGSAVVLRNAAVVPNLTSENFIGVSNDTYADQQSATIQVVGAVNDAQNGLTAGQSFFVQTDGSLSQTPDTPNVFAGTALSSTNLLIKG